jgi:hypothetical protein
VVDEVLEATTHEEFLTTEYTEFHGGEITEPVVQGKKKAGSTQTSYSSQVFPTYIQT